MKRFLTLIIMVAIVLSMVGCSVDPSVTTGPVLSTEPTTTTSPEDPVTETEPTQKKEPSAIAPSPLARPEYTFDHAPTTDELRAMAVQVMRDSLSFQWSTDKFLYYRRTVNSKMRDFSFAPGSVFGGMPYTNASGGIFQMLEYYDSETGALSIPINGQEIDSTFGNSCAGTIYSAWAAVCNSFVNYAGSTYYMVEANGCPPVGSYTYPYTTSLKAYTSDRICQQNGKEVMFSCYAQVLPADGLVSQPDNHAIMAIEPAHVEYLTDGSIDGAKSYIAIQDQRAGTGGFYYTAQDGDTTIHYSGRLRHEYTFDELWNLSYIPCTMGEFIGTDSYEIPQVNFTVENPTTVDDLLKGKVVSNYVMNVLRLVLTDENGHEEIIDRILFKNSQIGTGAAMNYYVREFSRTVEADTFKTKLKDGKTYTLSVDVVLANGQIFRAVQVPVSK